MEKWHLMQSQQHLREISKEAPFPITRPKISKGPISENEGTSVNRESLTSYRICAGPSVFCPAYYQMPRTSGSLARTLCIIIISEGYF